MRVAAALLACALLGCATAADPMHYRLAATGELWSEGEGADVLDEARARYPEFFEEVLDPSRVREPDLRPLRGDLEFTPVDRRNFDALHAVAIAYYEYNYQAESDRGGPRYFANSALAARMLSLPWRAYGEVEHAGLRDAMLDFFADVASGDKLATRTTAPRLARIVESLARKEADPARQERIDRIAAAAAAHAAPR